MHITDFLNQVDKLAASMTKAQLVEFVHDQARKLPESMRSDFLKELSGDTDSSRSKSKEAGSATFPEDLIEEVYRDLERIRNSEVCLTEEYAEGYNGNYNSWYYDEDEPMTYYDNDNFAFSVILDPMVIPSPNPLNKAIVQKLFDICVIQLCFQKLGGSHLWCDCFPLRALLLKTIRALRRRKLP